MGLRKGINTVVYSGWVGSRIRIVKTEDRPFMVSFTVCNDPPSSPVPKKYKTWIRCGGFGAQFKNITENLKIKTGDYVIIEGHLRNFYSHGSPAPKVQLRVKTIHLTKPKEQFERSDEYRIESDKTFGLPADF